MFENLTKGQRWALGKLLQRGALNYITKNIPNDVRDPDMGNELIDLLDEVLWSGEKKWPV